MNVLVIDDVLLHGKMIRKLLNEFPEINVTILTNVPEGIQAYLTENFDLVFLDVMMPDLNGYHFLKIASKLMQEGKLPFRQNITITTAIYDSNQVKELMSYLCVETVIQKPFRRNQILTAIRYHLYQNQAMDGS